MVLKDPRFKSCERIYTIDLFIFFQNQLSTYVCLSVTNCSLDENILDAFRIAQTWHESLILRMFAVVKCRGHTNFDLSKVIKNIPN